MPSQARKDEIAQVTDDLSQAEKVHQDFEDRCDEWYDSYRGRLVEGSDAEAWTSKLHPPYIHQIIETILAGMLDRTLRFAVSPRPKQLEPDQWQQLVSGATALEDLIAYELDVDHFADKLRPFYLQGLICGVTVGKTYWETTSAKVNRLEIGHADIHDDQGGYIGRLPALQEVSRHSILRDGPTFEVCDVRDFFWQEGAPSLAQSRFAIHRLWKLYEDIEEGYDAGIYGPDVGGDSDFSSLKNAEGTTAANEDREQRYTNSSRTKERIEVLEHWTRKQVITIANRTVVLSKKENPFWHGEFPFVVGSALPDLFQIPGMSIVALVDELQEMLWTLTNQRLDALRLLANAVMLIRTDVDDPDAFQFEPGAKWPVESVDQVKPLYVDANLPRMTLEAESLIKGDLQNITGGAPFLSGASSQTVDQKTATGVSIVTSLAQKMVQSRKENFEGALAAVGRHFGCLLQQFMREERAIKIVGPDASILLHTVDPLDIQGEYDYYVEVTEESLMRQERRAEAQALAQIAVQSAPVYQATGQPLNLRAFMEDLLKAFGKKDVGRYFSAQPQGAMPPGGPQPPSGANGGPPGPGGVTAPEASSPTSPSNQVSVSPEVFMQRAMASRGGPANAG